MIRYELYNTTLSGQYENAIEMLKNIAEHICSPNDAVFAVLCELGKIIAFKTAHVSWFASKKTNKNPKTNVKPMKSRETEEKI